jgi:hypothetical protein
MSVTSAFFVMPAAELRDLFPGWLPVRPEPTLSELVNPFTGKKSVVKVWLPAVDPAASAAEPGAPDLGGVARLEFRRIEHVKLAKLFVLMKGGDFTTRLEQMTRPALLAPGESDEMGLHRIDDEFTTALGALNGSKMSGTADAWAETEEMRLDRFTVADCESVLSGLTKLAQQARRSQQGLYFYWSL